MKRLVLLLGLCLLNPYGVSAAASDSGQNGFYYLSPVPNAAMVSAHTTLIFRPTATLREEMPDWTSHVEVVGRVSGIHAGRWIFARDGRTFIFEPRDPFRPGEVVAVRLRRDDHEDIGLRNALYTFRVSSSTAAPPAPKLDDLLTTLGIQIPPGQTPGEPGRCAPPVDYDLPDDFPGICIEQADDPSPGGIFVGAFVAGGRALYRTYLMILNDAGVPLFWRGKANSMFLDFKKQPDGRLSYFDYAENKYYFLDTSYSVVDSVQCQGYATDLHDVQVLPDGDVLVMGTDPQTVDMSAMVEGGDPDAIVTGLVIQEQDVDRNVVFQWRSLEHIDILDADHIDLTRHTIDYVHANSVALDDDGNIIVSCRHLSAVLKINRDTGDVMWWLGGKHNDFTLLGDDHWFSHQHSCRRLPGGTITLFDNGRYSDPRVSRAIEYRMDEVNKTVTLVWSFTHDPPLLGSAMGNVQRLADGNTMIGWGTANPNVTEVRPDGSTAFEMSFPTGTFTYRAFRYEWDGAAEAPFLWSTTGDHELRLDFTWFGVDGVKGYDIYRSDAGGPFVLAGHSDGDRFIVHNFVEGEPLQFKVKAFTHGHNGGPFSNTISVTPEFDDNVIAASLAMHPRTLNIESRGDWVDARIELPDECGCGPADVDVSSIRLNGTVPAATHPVRIAASGSGVTMSLKFDRAAVADALEGKGDVEVTGLVGTHTFVGYDHINVFAAASGGKGTIAPKNEPSTTAAAPESGADPRIPTAADALLGGVPNPFNPTTQIRYSVATGGAVVDIRIFDVAGRMVRTLVDGRQDAGVHSVVWDGRDEHGRSMPSGVYFCRMRSGDYSQTRKIVLAK